MNMADFSLEPMLTCVIHYNNNVNDKTPLAFHFSHVLFVREHCTPQLHTKKQIFKI